jgi:COMPASS component SWD2
MPMFVFTSFPFFHITRYSLTHFPPPLSCSPLQGLLNVAGTPCCAYDPSGAVFAVVLNLRSTVMLYDTSNFDKAPFLCVHIDDPVLRERSYPPRTPIYTSCEFSNDGKWLLVGTSGDTHYVLDSFEGGVVARLECACFSLSSVPFFH